MKTEKTELNNRSNPTQKVEIRFNTNYPSLIFVDGNLTWYCETKQDIYAQIDLCFENGFFDDSTEITFSNTGVYNEL